MDLEKFVKINNTEQILYKDADYLMSNEMEVFFRLYNRKQREEQDYIDILSRIFKHLTLELETEAQISPNSKALYYYSQITNHYNSSNFLRWVGKQKRVSSLDELAALMLEYVTGESNKSDSSYWQSPSTEAFYPATNEVIKAIRLAVLRSARAYRDESEWLIKDAKLKIPEGSQLFFVLGYYENYQEKYEELISKYNLRDKYKVFFIRDKDINKYQQMTWNKKEVRYRQENEQFKKTVDSNISKALDAVINEILISYEKGIVKRAEENFDTDEKKLLENEQIINLYNAYLEKFVGFLQAEKASAIKTMHNYPLYFAIDSFKDYLKEKKDEFGDEKSEYIDEYGNSFYMDSIIYGVFVGALFDIPKDEIIGSIKERIGSDLYRIYKTQDIRFKDGGNVSDFSKVISSSSRFKPKETIVFNPPLIGTNGAKLTAYTWAYEMTMLPNREGELVGRRVSDWTQAEISAETGRDIVHQYTIELPNGDIKTVSSESVPIILGFIDKSQAKVFGNLATASKTLAKQQMKLAIMEAQKKEYDDLVEKFTKEPKPSIRLASSDEIPFAFQKYADDKDKASKTWFAMGDVVEGQDNPYTYKDGNVTFTPVNRPSNYLIDGMTSSWITNRVKEAGGLYPSGLYELKNRVDRQKRKVEQMLNTQKMEGGGQIEYHLGGDMTKHFAPNGMPSNLTHEQWHLVRTPEFKAWFGDWEKLAITKLKDAAMDEITLQNLSKNVSKVVDENGEPLVVYHGTKNEFSEFRPNKFIFTSESIEYQKKLYTEKSQNIFKLFGNSKNILDLSKLGKAEWNLDKINQFFKEHSIDLVVAKARSTYAYFTFNDVSIEKLKRAGYDGVYLIYEERFVGEIGKSEKIKYGGYIFLDSNQVKLADGNNTTFDGSNADIRFDGGGRVEKLIEQDVVDLKMYDTTPEHAKEYGIDANKPLYVQNLWVSENERLKGIGKEVLNYLEDYARKNGNDVIFGYVESKASFSKDSRQTFFSDVEIIKNWLHGNGYAINDMNNDFHKVILKHGGELKKGIRAEMEHRETIEKFKRAGVSDKEVATSIAQDHLDEDPNYYTKLDEMESEMAKGGLVVADKKKYYAYINDKQGVGSFQHMVNAKPVKLYDSINNVPIEGEYFSYKNNWLYNIIEATTGMAVVTDQKTLNWAKSIAATRIIGYNINNSFQDLLQRSIDKNGLSPRYTVKPVKTRTPRPPRPPKPQQTTPVAQPQTNTDFNRAAFSLQTPTNEPSRLSYLQQILVRTKAFKEWFGDWELAAKSYLMDNKSDWIKHYNNISKCLDLVTLEPKLVYHGTRVDNEFFEFDVTMQAGLGRPYAYFAHNREYSENFTQTAQRPTANSNPYLYTVFLRAKNPFIANTDKYLYRVKDGNGWLNEIINTICWDLYKTNDVNEQTQKIARAVESQIEGYVMSAIGQIPMPFWTLMARDTNGAFKAFLMSYKYDSIFYGEEIKLSYDASNPAEYTQAITIFNPTDIKLGDGRNLNFNPMKADIRLEKGGNLPVDNIEQKTQSGLTKKEQLSNVLFGNKYEKGGNLDESTNINPPKNFNPIEPNKNREFVDDLIFKMKFNG
jgi:GNAT superfamily N-acetyltransferase